MNTNDSINVATQLRLAGVEVTNTLQNILGTPAKAAGASAATISSDTLNGGAAIASAFAGVTELAAKVVPWVSGALWLGSAIAAAVQDAKKTTPEPDPYVLQLQQLTEQDTKTTTSAATRFNQDLMSANAIFFNGVFSDWFRLQSVALLSTDQGYSGWYVSDQATDRSSYLTALLINQRTKLWQQILPQYFSKVAYTGAASGWLQATQLLDSVGAADFFGKGYPPWDGQPVTSGPITPSTFTAYSWDDRTTAGSAVCEDYLYIFQNGKFGTVWPNAFGLNLMGNSVNSDGNPQLNLDRNFVYEAMQLPWFQNYPQTVRSFIAPDEDANYQFDYSCGAHPEPFNAGGTPVFQDLTSQTIPEGTAGKIVVGSGSKTSFPPGMVNITIAGTTGKAPIVEKDGTFSITLGPRKTWLRPPSPTSSPMRTPGW